MSFFPPSQRQDDIKFLFAKKLAYKNRLWIVLILLITGILIESAVNFWLGLAFLVIGTGLSLITGYAVKPVIKRGAEKWSQVTPDEYKKVKARQEQLKKWDLDFFDITNPLGGFGFAALGIICILVFIFFFCRDERLAVYWGLDCFVLFVPHWVTGVRSFLRKDRLIIKIDLLTQIIEYLSSPSDVQLLPMLSTLETERGGTIPVDARLMLRFLNAPEYFLGLQVQVSINSVQGKDYPYLYCVIIAKQEAALFRKEWRAAYESQHPNLTIEENKSEGVDVLVIRQRTTTSSGYYTNLKSSRYIVDTSLNIARKLLSN